MYHNRYQQLNLNYPLPKLNQIKEQFLEVWVQIYSTE